MEVNTAIWNTTPCWTILLYLLVEDAPVDHSALAFQASQHSSPATMSPLQHVSALDASKNTTSNSAPLDTQDTTDTDLAGTQNQMGSRKLKSSQWVQIG